MKTVAVIASNSFTGSHFVDALLENTKAKVIGISRSPEYNSIFLPYAYKKKKSGRFEFHQLDINKNLREMLSLLDREEPEAIINLAAQGEVQHSWDNPADWFQTNAVGIVNLTNALKDRKYIKHYIHTSTPEVYGSCEGGVKENYNYQPSTPYAASKAAGDIFMYALYKTHNFPLTLTRSTNVYGMHQQLYRIIPRTIIYLKMGKKIQLHGGGIAKKAYIHVRDAADGVMKILEAKNPSELYHFSPNNEGYAIRDIVKMICEKMDRDFEKCTETVPERKGQDAKYHIDSTKARKELGWAPKVKLEDGIEEMINWVDDCWDEIKKQPHEYIHKPSL
ncbi:TPA: GDP-mannose 4,6-dehydratase [archaeon]|nr:GDP-mannose 4,6-dehydratase [Candidatus Naiadarchaeales archaeon SRR2090153.bin461]HIK02433.1 GDP-mannose 4,6-dehydratase [Candidatus Naiadarchaeales archaeon SRR2090159.bin1288]